MLKISINVPTISRNAEFPLVFLLIFLPAYLSQTALPRGVFDFPLYQGQIILQSLLIFLLLRYLLENRKPGSTVHYDSAFSPALKPFESLISFAGLTLIYLFFTFVLPPLLSSGIPDGPGTEPVLITRAGMLPLALISCLAAATMEEFFFRGYAWIRLKESGLNSLVSLLTVSLLFAAGHLYEGLPAAFFAWASGLFLGVLVIRGFTLYSLSLSHGLFNFSMILISYLRQGPSS